MWNRSEILSCNLPPHIHAWRCLVSRSTAAWDEIISRGEPLAKNIPTGVLLDCQTLDDFLEVWASRCMPWLFQRRSTYMAQKRLRKWSRDQLDDYVPLPALPGFVSSCAAIASSSGISGSRAAFSDPDGQYLRLTQANLEPQT